MQDSLHQAQPYLVGIGTLALINAAFAQITGRSPVLWGLLTFAFGPFVTLFLILTYKKNA
jgi:hypothetical protein